MKRIYLIDFNQNNGYLNFNQIGGYKHSLYLISHLRRGLYKRDLYGDWSFLNGSYQQHNR